ncbi:hypothetical protein AGLY_013493 [Aphis glycines]|uniref:Uncharacterized protein n=1 Tax=Aphis glycines TaxID=307491 RepID=A0A6G0T8L8_APHGL|nr:hypothetical protein AGLY_013493 [Aphis glycines]
MWNASRFCVSSLRRGHANLLCIVPILVYVLPKQTSYVRAGISSSEYTGSGALPIDGATNYTPNRLSCTVYTLLKELGSHSYLDFIRNRIKASDSKYFVAKWIWPEVQSYNIRLKEVQRLIADSAQNFQNINTHNIRLTFKLIKNKEGTIKNVRSKTFGKFNIQFARDIDNGFRLMWAPVNMSEMVWSQYKCIKLILKKNCIIWALNSVYNLHIICIKKTTNIIGFCQIYEIVFIKIILNFFQIYGSHFLWATANKASPNVSTLSGIHCSKQVEYKFTYN